MLASSSSTSSRQSSTTGNSSVSTASVASPLNNIKNIKCEPYSTLSPCNENTNSQNMLEDNSNNNNTLIDTNIRENTNTTSMLRQNSNSSINSCSATVNASSPNNGSDHSNSSNISSNISQTVEMCSDILNLEKSAINNTINNVLVKEEENGKHTNNKSDSPVCSSKNVLSTFSSINNTLSSVKEEADMINNKIKVKKEDTTVSPDMSPVGFGSIGNVASSNEGVAERELPHAKPNDISSNATGGNNSDKIATLVGASSGCSDDIASGRTVNISSTIDVCGVGNGNTQQHPSSNIFGNNSGSSGGNCMDYMQQQNHIFVFSTHLANKGAESVLSGQFPTIIAYHCTQPATKSFLEDFFIKNPMKITKLQRQNSLNICSISVAGGQPWMSGGGNSLPKVQSKSNGGKINFGALNTNVDHKPHGSTLQSPSIPGFPETSDTLPNNNELMCWEQTRNNIDGGTSEVHPIKLLDGVELSGPHHNVAINHQHASKSISSNDGGVDSGIQSLQGVKVPDENLTPQQRQHREEQLAKLKKMNQFLFPENGNDFRTDNGSAVLQDNSLDKLTEEGVSGNMAGIILNLPVSVGSGMTPQIVNTQNTRNLTPNSSNPNKPPENLPTPIGDDAIVTSDMLGAHDMTDLQCNVSKGQCSSNIAMNSQTCVSSPMGLNNNSINIMSGNSVTCHGNIGINGPGGMIPNSTEVMTGFTQNCGGSDVSLGGGPPKVGVAGIHAQEINQVGTAQIEWSKLQHQFFEERLKGGSKSATDIITMPPMCNSVQRPNLTGLSTNSTGHNQAVRSTQGPPPPYHPTQRSASVPIATQSPNPASPNNPTSNLSLPSPRTSGTLGITANSPNMDIHASSLSAATPTSIISTTATSTTMSNTNTQAKNSSQQDSSPTNSNNGNNGNRRSLNQFNSNPSTPISHMSPKDLESYNSTVAGDLKNARPSPQRSRTPLITPINNIVEAANIEGRFNQASPGLSFSAHAQNPNNGTVSNYKGSGPIERQNSAPVPSQFCRRTDNIPLNPNSNRPSQNKLSHSFDPISSLAQMSQQLTSSVSLNTGVGNSTGVMGTISSNDIHMSTNVNQSIDGLINSLDAGMDHCSPGGSNNMGPLIGSTGQFISNNCHINSMLGPMGQRFLNPKMCGGFNPANGGIREGPGTFHGVMPSHRMMGGRMPVNFGNFNVSPNIQVKASTPNTIQYMPVRPQNSNTNNMRVPPSLEFLQRYANPSMAGAGNVMDNGNTGAPNDSNKIANSANNIGCGNAALNFFQNCNQQNPMSIDQEDLPGGMMPTHDMNLHASMIRGMRPMRHHNVGHGNANPSGSVPRIQVPGANIGGPGMSQFPGPPLEALECSDATLFNASATGPNQMYTGGSSQKTVKGMINSANNGQVPNPGILQNEHNALQSPVNGPIILGPNNMMPSGVAVQNNSTSVAHGGNGNVNYKSFVGPSSNNIKYAQQYHSFQQQLYATSTRSQQTGNVNTGTNSSNPAYFVNK